MVTRKFPIMQLVLCLLILLYFVVIGIQTPGLPHLTRLVPLIVIIFAIPIGIIELLTVFNQKAYDFFSGTALVGRKSVEEKEAEIELSSQVKAIAWMLSYVALFFLVGPLLATVIAPLVVMKYLGKMSWRKSITVMAATWVMIYVIFVVLIQANLPRGLLFGSIY